MATTHQSINLNGREGKCPHRVCPEQKAVGRPLTLCSRSFPAQVPTSLFINNTWVTSSTGTTFQTHNPATGEKLLEFQGASDEDVDRAVKAARVAFNTTWGRNVAPGERTRCMFSHVEVLARSDRAHRVVVV